MSLENLIFRCLERYWSDRYNERFGVVTSYDPKTHSAKLKIMPQGQETGWVPIHAHHVGNGWGILVGLTPGDQVKLSHQGGDFEAGEITNRVHDDEDKPPEVQSGEILFKHKNAGWMFFDKKKNITWHGANGQKIITDAKGNTKLYLKLDPNASGGGTGSDGTGGMGGSEAPQFLVDMNDGDHQIVIDANDGILHKSKTRVTVKAPQIHHDGDLNVTGSVYAEKTIQSATGLSAPVSDAPSPTGGGPVTPAKVWGKVEFSE